MSQDFDRALEALSGLGLRSSGGEMAGGVVELTLSPDDYPALSRTVERSLRAEKELPRGTLRAVGRSLRDAREALFSEGEPFTVAVASVRDGTLLPHLKRLSEMRAGARMALCAPGLDGVLQLRPGEPVHIAEAEMVVGQPELVAWRVVETAANRGREAYPYGGGAEQVGRKAGLAHLRRGLAAMGFEVGGPVRRWPGAGLPATADASPVVFDVGATLKDAGVLRRGLEANPRLLPGPPTELDPAFMEEEARLYIQENGRLDLYFLAPEGEDIWAPLRAVSGCPVFERMVLTPPGMPWGGVVGGSLVVPLVQAGRRLAYLLFLLTQGLPWFRYWEAAA